MSLISTTNQTKRHVLLHQCVRDRFAQRVTVPIAKLDAVSVEVVVNAILVERVPGKRQAAS